MLKISQKFIGHLWNMIENQLILKTNKGKEASSHLVFLIQMMPQRNPIADKEKMLLEMVTLYKRKIEYHHLTMPNDITDLQKIIKITNVQKKGQPNFMCLLIEKIPPFMYSFSPKLNLILIKPLDKFLICIKLNTGDRGTS